MSNTTRSVNIQPDVTSHISVAALVLGILSLPGSLFAWDALPGGRSSGVCRSQSRRCSQGSWHCAEEPPAEPRRSPASFSAAP